MKVQNEIIINNVSRDVCKLIINSDTVYIGKLTDVCEKFNFLAKVLTEYNIPYNMKILEREVKEK